MLNGKVTQLKNVKWQSLKQGSEFNETIPNYVCNVQLKSFKWIRQ